MDWPVRTGGSWGGGGGGKAGEKNRTLGNREKFAIAGQSGKTRLGPGKNQVKGETDGDVFNKKPQSQKKIHLKQPRGVKNRLTGKVRRNIQPCSWDILGGAEGKCRNRGGSEGEAVNKQQTGDEKKK